MIVFISEHIMKLFTKIAFSLAIALSSFSVSHTVHAFGVGLTPSTVELEVQPGSNHRQVLKVKNFNTEKPIKLTVSVADWALDKNGKVVLAPPSESGKSSSSWVNFSPSTLLIEPDTTQNVVVDLTAPLSVKSKGSHRTAIILSTVLPSKEQRAGKQGVWNRYQIATLFYANILPGKSKPALTQATFTSGSEVRKEQSLQFHIENSGDRHIRMDGSVFLRNAENEKVAEQPFQGVLLDHYSRDFNVSFGDLDLAPGDYHVAFDISGDGKTVPVRLDETPVLRIQ